MTDNDPRRELVFSTLWRVALTTLLCFLPFLKFGFEVKNIAFSVLIFAPCAFLLAKPLIGWLGVFGLYVYQQPNQKWQGRYYAFSGHHIRVFPIDGALWFVETDVLNVIAQKRAGSLVEVLGAADYGAIPGTRLRGLSERGVEKLLRASQHADAQKMLMWIEREVVKPFRRRLELGLPPW
jgi:hypothetical protein